MTKFWRSIPTHVVLTVFLVIWVRPQFFILSMRTQSVTDRNAVDAVTFSLVHLVLICSAKVDEFREMTR